MAEALIEHFKAMARNNRWANFRLLNACRALDRAAFLATRTNFFPSLAGTLNHIYAIDLYYLDALEQGGIGRAAYETHIDIEDAGTLAAKQAAADFRLIDFCDRLAPRDPARTVTTDRGERGSVTERIDALLAHLFQHQIHHRGQAHAMLAGTGVAPPQLDDFFLQYGRAPDIGAALER